MDENDVKTVNVVNNWYTYQGDGVRRRDFLKLVAISLAGSTLGLDLSDVLASSGMPEKWTLSVDEDSFDEAVTIESVTPGSDEVRPYVTVTIDTGKIWPSVALTDAHGRAFHTADGEVWHDENGVTLDAYLS